MRDSLPTHRSRLTVALLAIITFVSILAAALNGFVAWNDVSDRLASNRWSFAALCILLALLFLASPIYGWRRFSERQYRSATIAFALPFVVMAFWYVLSGLKS